MTAEAIADLLRVRSTMRDCAHRAGLGLTATTKVVTAGSELARTIRGTRVEICQWNR